MSTTVQATGNRQRPGIWDAADCVLLLIDYQQNVLEQVFEQDRRLVELNARALATAAVNFKIPVVLSTVGVEMGSTSRRLRRAKPRFPASRKSTGPR